MSRPAQQRWSVNRRFHLYADHPEVQMGPLALLLAAPFTLIHPARLGEILMMLSLSLVGLGCLRQMSFLSPASNAAHRRSFLLLGVLFVITWTEISVHWEHPDDAMALLCVVVGLRFIRDSRWLGGVILLAMSADFKPWALAFVPILLLTPRSKCVVAALTWSAVVVAVWTPFILVDHTTLARLASFVIPNDRASVLRVFEIDDPRTPSWCRAAQLVGGAGLALALVRRGRWPAVILCVVTVRMLLDPGTKTYYDAGLVLGAVVFDLAARQGRWPWATVLSMTLVLLPSYILLHEPTLRGLLRAVGLLTILCLAWVLDFRKRDLAQTRGPTVITPGPHLAN